MLNVDYLTVYLKMVPASVRDRASWTLWWYGADASASPWMRKKLSLSIFLALCVASASTYPLKLSTGNPIIRSVNAESKDGLKMFICSWVERKEKRWNEREERNKGFIKLRCYQTWSMLNMMLENTHCNRANRWWGRLLCRTWILSCSIQVSWPSHNHHTPNPKHQLVSRRDISGCSTGTCI